MKKLKVVILAALIIFCGGTLAAAPLARTNNYDTIKTISSVTQSTLNEMAAVINLNTPRSVAMK